MDDPARQDHVGDVGVDVRTRHGPGGSERHREDVLEPDRGRADEDEAALERRRVDQRLLPFEELLLGIEEVVERVRAVGGGLAVGQDRRSAIANETAAALLGLAGLAVEAGDVHDRRGKPRGANHEVAAIEPDLRAWHVQHGLRGGDAERGKEQALAADERDDLPDRAVLVHEHHVVSECAGSLAEAGIGAGQRWTQVDALVESVVPLRRRSQRPVHVVGAGGALVDAFGQVDDVAGGPRRVDQRLVGFGARSTWCRRRRIPCGDPGR